MKRYLVFGLVILAFACSRQEGFKINVNLDGAEGKVLLEQRASGAWVPVDTADIVDGTAVLEGKVNIPGDYYLSLLGEHAKTLLFVENSNMTVTGKADSLNAVKVTGSATHDEYKEIESQIQKIADEYMSIYQNSRQVAASGDTAKAREMMDKVNELYESTNKMQEDFVKNHPSSYATPYFLSRVQYNKSAEGLDSLVSMLDPKLDASPTVADLKDRIEKMKKVAVGQIAPDFTQNDPEGNPVKLSDVYSKNKYTLIDFWASWCGPCRRENPNVVAVFNDYKDKGFGVIGVSLDREKDAWLKAIDDDHLTWPHVSDLAYWSNEAAKLYAISSIPSNLLVDQNGKIIAKNKREEELRKTISDLLD